MNENNKEHLKLEKKISCPKEIDEIFQLVYQDKMEDLISFIINEKNEIWNIKRGDNITILHSACVLDKPHIIETIIKQLKVRLNLISENSLTNEEKAKNEEIFKNYINAKTEADGLTALHFASFRGNIKIIKLLISNHADLKALSYNGLNMLHKAAQGNKPSAIIYFYKKYNMDLEAVENNKKLNALHLATISGMDNSVIFLLRLGINPNIQDNRGYTALHYAVKYKHTRIIKKLIQNGANKDIKESINNKTPSMMAKKNPEIIEIFRKKGICEKLFFKPDIYHKTFFSNQNMILFLVLHIIVIFLTFSILIPIFNNTRLSISYLVISLIVFLLFLLLSLSNPGIMKNVEYLNLLDIVENGEEAENFCPYCLIRHKFRSKHCLICQKCIEEFDHHCFWVGNCIGKNNFMLFFIFLIYVNLNTLFNTGITIFYLITEIVNPMNYKEKSFPGLFFGKDSFVYKKLTRIFIAVFDFVISLLFFIPLIDLFKTQLYNAIEKRRNRIEEEEYEKNMLIEKLKEDENNKIEIKENFDNEIWEDIRYRKESIDDKVDFKEGD